VAARREANRAMLRPAGFPLQGKAPYHAESYRELQPAAEQDPE
jgi:hypothetical protein